MRAIILAGGKGTRLKPYTTIIPKPLVPIGGEMPILEVVIRQLAGHGFNHITLAVNHMANLIMAFFGDGEKWNVKIDYSMEEKPLSTIGPLTLIDDLPDNFLVMNGDILSDLNYRQFYEHHVSKGNLVSVSSHKRKVEIDYGVLEYDSNNIINGFKEKPTYNFNVSMGIYCLSRSVIEKLSKNESYGFDNLMVDGIRNGDKIEIVPFDGYWLDIGRPEDYDDINENYDQVKNKLGI